MQHMSKQSVQFISGLLEFSEDERIGSDSAGGAAGVRAHAWWNTELPLEPEDEDIGQGAAGS